jgi:beta-glucan synthesis-associated protein KRE6
VFSADVIEAQTNAQTRIGEVSLSSQWAPFNPGYNWLNETHMKIEDGKLELFLTRRSWSSRMVPLRGFKTCTDTPPLDSVTHLNTYKGGVFQETTSGVADTNQDCYEIAQDGTEGCFAVYAIECGSRLNR